MRNTHGTSAHVKVDRTLSISTRDQKAQGIATDSYSPGLVENVGRSLFMRGPRAVVRKECQATSGITQHAFSHWSSKYKTRKEMLQTDSI